MLLGYGGGIHDGAYLTDSIMVVQIRIINIVLAKKIREAREKKNLTQAEVAKKAGLNTNYYAVIERGEVKPSVDKLERILKALGIKLTLP